MRLIDADALRDKLQAEIDKAIPPYDEIPPFDDVIVSIRCGVRLAQNIVENEPTVDAVPIRHGKWKVTSVYIKCSECGESFMLIPQNYCPNCGARMNEE